MDPEVLEVERGEDKTVKKVVLYTSGIIFTCRIFNGKMVISRSTWRRTTTAPLHEYIALKKKAYAIFDAP